MKNCLVYVLCFVFFISFIFYCLSEESLPRKKLSRKRKKQPHLHKRNIAKQNVEHGREHVTKTGTKIPAKIFEGQIICKCQPYCSSKIDIARQEDIFNAYYEDSNKAQKTLLIRASIKMTPVAEKKDKFMPLIPQKKREYNFKYYLSDNMGMDHAVCRSFLLGVYKISPSAMNRAVKSAIKNPSASEKRGKSSSANRTSEQAKEGVRCFINRFPKYESHYGRSSSQKMYLNSNMNLAKMYKLYKEECERIEITAVSEAIFRRIFNYDFNLSFKKRHTDTCSTCDSTNIYLDNKDLPEEEKKKLQAVLDNHYACRQRIAIEFKNNCTTATDETVVLTFDLQKVLDTPSLTTKIAYYKRQLATYNLCIFDEISKKGM